MRHLLDTTSDLQLLATTLFSSLVAMALLQARIIQELRLVPIEDWSKPYHMYSQS
jgi:hypothetical protein